MCFESLNKLFLKYLELRIIKLFLRLNNFCYSNNNKKILINF